jgi:predicted transcriptional regulator
MSRRWTLYNRLNQDKEDGIRKLLGDLEYEVMARMWQRGEATVRDIATDLQVNRQIAYTTVMTVMGNLAEKGLLTRSSLDRKTHLYRVALTREEFLERASRQMVDRMVEDFGDLALVRFIETVEQVDPERFEQLLKRVDELRSQQPYNSEHSESSDQSQGPRPGDPEQTGPSAQRG